MDHVVAEVVRRATPMWRRALGTTSVAEQPSMRHRLKRWESVIGTSVLLEKRIRNANIDRTTLMARLDDLAGPASQPPWAETFERVIHAIEQQGTRRRAPPSDRTFDSRYPFPFQEVFVPFLDVARAGLGVGGSLGLLHPKARAALERQLLSNLTFVAGLVMAAEFYDYRFSAAPASAFESAWAAQPRTTRIYTAFITDMACGGLMNLFDRYPVLARLLCQLVDQWITATRNMCDRFATDFDELAATHRWTFGREPGCIRKVRANLSDRHGDGQSVVELVLRSGQRLIYKPRPVTAELAFQQVIAWLNGKARHADLRSFEVTSRDGYGWVEAVVPAPCKSEAAVGRFYRRTGMLLAALHVLAVTDIHRDNLIAAGEHPVVVDLETMLYSTPRGVRPSVLHTGMLPQWQRSADGKRFDMSALASDAAQDHGVTWVAWASINSDQMVLKEETPAGPVAHRVRLGTRFPEVKDYESELLQGFEHAYVCFERNRDELIRDLPLRAVLDGLDLRVLVRDTATYVQLQLHALQPAYLRDGLDRSIELEWLARPLMSLKEPHAAAAALYEAEWAALEALDVPYFHVGSVTLDALADSRNMARVFGRRRDSEVFVRRLKKLGPSDLRWQASVVARSIDERFQGSGVQSHESDPTPAGGASTIDARS